MCRQTFAFWALSLAGCRTELPCAPQRAVWVCGPFECQLHGQLSRRCHCQRSGCNEYSRQTPEPESKRLSSLWASSRLRAKAHSASPWLLSHKLQAYLGLAP